MEATEQTGAVAAVYEDQDPDFASCPQGDDEQEDIHPPYGSLEDVDAGAERATVAGEAEEPERLASLRLSAEDREPPALPQQQLSSPGSRSVAGTEDVAGQLQQLISVVGILANRLERVEAASSSDASSGSQWRPRSDTVNLGYVDTAALDRWCNQTVQEWTGPAGDMGGGPPMSAPGPPTGSGMEFANPWFSGPAGWFRQFGNWLGPRGFGGQVRGQSSELRVPPFPGVQGQAGGALQDPGQVGALQGAQGPGQVGALQGTQGLGQVGALPLAQDPGQVGAPQDLQGPGQAGALQGMQGPGQVGALPGTQGPGQVGALPVAQDLGQVGKVQAR